MNSTRVYFCKLQAEIKNVMRTKVSIVFLLFLMVFAACNKKKIPVVDYQYEMRKFVISIASYAKSLEPQFIVIPQNGASLIGKNNQAENGVDQDYVNAIDGQGQEDLFYGYDHYNQETNEAERDEILPFLDLALTEKISVLVTDYCNSPEKIDDANAQNKAKGYCAFAAPDRELSGIPTHGAFNDNGDDIMTLNEAENFLYLINPTQEFKTKSAFISSLDATNYDAFIIDLFYHESEPLTASDIASLQTKPNGSKRLVIAYMSIGEAEDYRYYWDENWSKQKQAPVWLYKENKKWKGNYKVFYWMSEWQSIIFGNDAAYLDRILMTGFDGVYLDIIDAFEYYESIKGE